MLKHDHMSHDAHKPAAHGHGHDDHPEPPPKKPKHGPGDCYGMPQKKFWRIISGAALLTIGVVVTTVILLST